MDPVSAVFYTWWLRAAGEACRTGGRAFRRSEDADEPAYCDGLATPHGWPRGLGPLGVAAAILIAILTAGWAMDLIAA